MRTFFLTLVLIFLVIACFAMSALKASASAKVEDPVVTLYTDVDDSSAWAVINAIHAANKIKTDAPIMFYINSDGGDVFAGSRIISAMESSRREVWTVDVGFAASEAGFIFCSGDRRFMLPYTVLMLHDGSLRASNSTDKVYSEIDFSKKVDDIYYERVAELSGLTVEQIRAKASLDWWMLEDEAEKNHLATSLVLGDYPSP